MRKNLLFSFLIVLLAGFFTFFSYEQKKPISPVNEDQSFVIVVPLHNPGKSLATILDSILAQTYKKYRIVLIDDGSDDNSGEVMENYLQDKAHRLLPTKIVTCEKQAGALQRLYETSFSCNEKQVIVFLDRHKSFTTKDSLATLNRLFKEKDPGVILAGPSHEKPFFFPHTSPSTYLYEKGLLAFSAKLFKQLPTQCFFHEGNFIQSGQETAFLLPLMKMTKRGYLHYPEKLVERNLSPTFSFTNASPGFAAAIKKKGYENQKLTLEKNKKADLVIFSFDRPLQLYALLESAHENLLNLDHLSVIYRVSSVRFSMAYEEVKTHFPDVTFLQQSSLPEKDFKPLLEETLFDPQKTSSYILFAVDDLVFTDKADISQCIEMMEKTGAYFFSLRLGDHIRHCYMGNKPQEIPNHVSFPPNIMGWQIAYAEGDFGFFHSVDATLYRKEDVKKILPRIQYKNPNTLEGWWNKTRKDPLCEKQNRIGLSYRKAKSVNIPLNVVNGSDNLNMNLFSPEDLLEKFEKNKKIDRSVFKDMVQDKVHMEIEPQFISRKKKETFPFHEQVLEEKGKS